MDISNPHHEDCPKGDRGPKGDKGDTGNTGPRGPQGPQGSSAGGLQLSGGTMTGALTLNADPTANLHAATKQYVDASPTYERWNKSLSTSSNTVGISGFKSGYQLLSIGIWFGKSSGPLVYVSLPPLGLDETVTSSAIAGMPPWAFSTLPTQITVSTSGGWNIKRYHILFIDGA